MNFHKIKEYAEKTVLLNLRGEPRMTAVQAVAPKSVATTVLPIALNAKPVGPTIKKPSAPVVTKPAADKVTIITLN